MENNKWFDEVFLPSIFDYVQKSAGSCKNCKISLKQFDICVRNMEPVECYDADYRKNFVYYRYFWNDRQITVFQRKNAFICFSFSKAESAVIKAEEAAEKEREKAERYAHIKSNPARLEKSINTKTEKINRLNKELAEAELIDNKDEDDLDYIEYLKNQISEIQAEINLLIG